MNFYHEPIQKNLQHPFPILSEIARFFSQTFAYFGTADIFSLSSLQLFCLADITLEKPGQLDSLHFQVDQDRTDSALYIRLFGINSTMYIVHCTLYCTLDRTDSVLYIRLYSINSTLYIVSFAVHPFPWTI